MQVRGSFTFHLCDYRVENQWVGAEIDSSRLEERQGSCYHCFWASLWHPTHPPPINPCLEMPQFGFLFTQGVQNVFLSTRTLAWKFGGEDSIPEDRGRRFHHGRKGSPHVRRGSCRPTSSSSARRLQPQSPACCQGGMSYVHPTKIWCTPATPRPKWASARSRVPGSAWGWIARTGQ